MCLIIEKKFKSSQSAERFMKNPKIAKQPSFEQMESYFPELQKKIDSVEKIWILGNCAYNYLITKKLDKDILFTIHPSRMNYNRYISNKENIITKIKKFING